MVGQQHNRRSLALAAAVTLVALTAASGNAGNGTEVEARGGFEFEPNEVIEGTLQWHDGDIEITSGDYLTIADHDDLPGEPHIFTIVNENEKPQTVEELFSGVCTTCNSALIQHDTNGNQQADPGDVFLIDVGAPGFNEVGDSVVVPDGQKTSIQVTAPPGTTLHFICPIHNEMQGVMKVR